MIVPDLNLVPRRQVVDGPIDVRFGLRPGDRPLVAAGDTLVPGSRIIDRVRDTRLVDVRGGSVPDDARPGDRWSPTAGSGIPLRRGSDKPLGELLFELNGQWRMAAGEHTEPIDTPIAGVVHEVRPGVGIGVRAEGRVIRGVEALGEPTRGVLAIGAEVGEGGGPGMVLRPGSLDVGLAGTILVIGSRVDAEALTRARAMGLRGVVVGGLAGKERRDFLNSEARQRASLHKLPTFAVLVLDGAIRRRIAGPIAAIFGALAGRDVAIVTDPPALVFDEPNVQLPAPAPDLVRVRAGERAGREGRWAGLAGLRRFQDGAFLESGWVQFEGAGTVAIPLADLERFG
ncbi:MAG TPA: hypothetical protein VFV72_06280 [Candidatus Limnocylindrales bacterium]|nr:hypothetical protein [Candidatus Limnocylindrales bacterium]